MAGNPLVPQGTLNRLRASIVWPNFPGLNVTPSFLGKEGISLSFEGDATTFLETMTGAVTSTEPYQLCTLKVHLLKTQSLSAAYKAQLELSSLLGNCTVRPDSTTLSPYQLSNMGIQTVDQLQFNGSNAGWMVNLKGYYLINSAAWDQADGLVIPGVNLSLAL